MTDPHYSMVCIWEGRHERCKGWVKASDSKTYPCDCPHHKGEEPPAPLSQIAPLSREEKISQAVKLYEEISRH